MSYSLPRKKDNKAKAHAFFRAFLTNNPEINCTDVIDFALDKPEPSGYAQNKPGTAPKGDDDFFVVKSTNPKEEDNLDDWEIVNPQPKGKYYTADYVKKKVHRIVDGIRAQYDEKSEALVEQHETLLRVLDQKEDMEAALEARQENLLMVLNQKEEIEELLRKDLAQRTLENLRLKARIARMENGEVFTEKLRDISLGEVDN